MRVVGRYLVVAGAVLGLVAVSASTGAASERHAASRVRTYSTPGTAPLRTALMDPVLFGGGQRAAAFTMTQAAGASYVRLVVYWRYTAPGTRPPGFVPTDPTSPGYHWTGIDAIVEDAEAAGLTPILDIVGTPSWAYDHRKSDGNAGSPKVADLGDFATALATHYDGSTPGVPAEHVFQVWNEPNLSVDLSPANGSTYRPMVNAVAAVK